VPVERRLHPIPHCDVAPSDAGGDGELNGEAARGPQQSQMQSCSRTLPRAASKREGCLDRRRPSVLEPAALERALTPSRQARSTPTESSKRQGIEDAAGRRPSVESLNCGPNGRASAATSVTTIPAPLTACATTRFAEPTYARLRCPRTCDCL
jgi:hypothetical protein